jgi:uncharacterized pyridoxamine 5'-phosphate oxidase family protein
MGTKEDALSFLKENKLISLSTVGSDGQPRITPVFYLIDDDFNVYFWTVSKSSKCKNIKENPKVSLQVWAKDIASVEIEGVASIVGDSKERDEIVSKIVDMALAEDIWPPLLRVKEKTDSNYTAYKISPKKVSILDLKSRKIHEEKSPITIFEF